MWILARTGLIPVGKLAQLAAEAERGQEPTEDVFALLLTMAWRGPLVMAVVSAVCAYLTGLGMKRVAR